MTQPNPFQSLNARPFAARLDRVKSFRVSQAFKAHSKVLRELEEYHDVARTVLEHIAEDRTLSDSGKAKRATRDAIAHTLKQLNAAEKQVRAGIHRRQQERADLLAKRTPQAPDLGALLRTMIAVSLTEGDAAARQALMDRMLQPDRNGTATPENAVALALPPEAFGAAGTARVDMLRTRLGLTHVGAEGQQLDVADHLASEELNALAELRGAVAACGDLEELVASGAIPKPFGLMAPEERVAYALEHGAQALNELAYRDRELLGAFVDPTPSLTFDQVDVSAPSPLRVQPGTADTAPVAMVAA